MLQEAPSATRGSRHASWPYAVEISFSLVQRKVLVPHDLASMDQVEPRIRLSEEWTSRQLRSVPQKLDRVQLAERFKRIKEKPAFVTET